MSDLNHTTRFYRQRFKQKEELYNKHSPLLDYFIPMIGDQHRIVIGEMGSGPINTIGTYVAGKDIEIVASDWFQVEYQKFWERSGKTPIIPIEYQNMERLTYPDESFDIVHCANAIDHTVNADLALKEFIRVCKPGGYVYLRHHLNQRSLHAREHRWDIRMEDGKCAVIGRHMRFFTEDFAPFTSRMEDGQVVSVWQK